MSASKQVDKIAAEIVLVCRQAWQQGHMPGTSGNVSARLDEERVLITPSGRLKSLLEPSDLLEVDLDGRVLKGEGRPSSEFNMHRQAYMMRPDVGAVVHAHATVATAMSLAGRELNVSGLPEMLIAAGRVPTAPYATPGTQELAHSVAPFLNNHNAIILDHHGVLTLGKSPLAAWALCEMLEHSAETVFSAELLGGANPLTERQRILCRIQGLKTAEPDQVAEPVRPLAERVERVSLELTDQFRTEKRWQDQRGMAHLIVDDLPVRRICLLTLEPGRGYRGGHLHQAKHEGFYVAQGKARVEIADAITGERLTWDLETGDRLWLPPGVAHRIEALEPLTFVEFTDRPYSAEDDVPFDFDGE